MLKSCSVLLFQNRNICFWENHAKVSSFFHPWKKNMEISTSWWNAYFPPFSVVNSIFPQLPKNWTSGTCMPMPPSRWGRPSQCSSKQIWSKEASASMSQALGRRLFCCGWLPSGFYSPKKRMGKLETHHFWWVNRRTFDWAMFNSYVNVCQRPFGGGLDLVNGSKKQWYMEYPLLYRGLCWLYVYNVC